jgi:hypothetical protein
MKGRFSWRPLSCPALASSQVARGPGVPSNLAAPETTIGQRAAARAMPRGPYVGPPDGVGESGRVTTASTVLRN